MLLEHRSESTCRPRPLALASNPAEAREAVIELARLRPGRVTVFRPRRDMLGFVEAGAPDKLDKFLRSVSSDRSE
jgi:hypothetical protein